MLVVWDSTHKEPVPVRTFLNPHPNGIVCMDLSTDNQYIVTIGAEPDVQTISLWDWTNQAESGPIVSMIIKTTIGSGMHWVKFNPDKNTEIAMNSGRRILFLSWKLGVSKFEYYSPAILSSDYSGKGNGKQQFTKTVFIPGQQQAVTGTDGGDILVFDKSLIIEGIGEQE